MYDVLCLLPLPNNTTSLVSKLTSDLFKFTTSETRNPVEYNNSKIALSLSVTQAFLNSYLVVY